MQSNEKIIYNKKIIQNKLWDKITHDIKTISVEKIYLFLLI